MSIIRYDKDMNNPRTRNMPDFELITDVRSSIAKMSDHLVSFIIQNPPLEKNSFNIFESVEILEEIPNHNFDEFLKNTIQNEPTIDVPDTI